MSFDRQTDRVMTGSLNLNPSTALIPPEDAIALENWRVDQAGALRSRLDISMIGDYGAAVHTLHTRLPGTRYVGTGTNLSRNGSNVIGGFDGTPLGMADMYGFTWVMNRSQQGRDNGAWAPWAPAAPAAAPTLVGPDAGGMLTIGQTYYWYVTWVDNMGQETNPSPAVSTTIADPNRFVSISVASLTPGPTIVGFNVYRCGDTLPQPYRVNRQTLLLSETNYCEDGGGLGADDIASHSDAALTEFGVTMPIDADPPPAARGLAGPYYERLLAYNTADYPNWLFWSRQGQPSFFPGSQYDEGNHVPVGDDGEEIVRVVLHARHARIFKTASIWRLSGDPGDQSSTLEVTNPEIGLVGPNAIDTKGDIDYFEGPEGIYSYNGYTAQKISPQLDPLFKGDPLPIGSNLAAMNLSPSVRTHNVIEVYNGRLYFSYASYSASLPDHTLICDLATGRWYSDDRGFTALYNEGQQGNFLGALAADNVVYALEQGQGSPLALVYQSGFRDQGQRDHQKTYQDVVIEHSIANGGSASLNAYAKFDDGLTSSLLGSIPVQGTAPASGRLRSTFRLETTEGIKDGVTARTCAVRIEGTTPVPVTIYGIDVHYYLHPRDALSFDSDKLHLNWQGVKRLELIEFDIDASGPVDYYIFADRPGGVMASKKQGTFDATTGRESQQLYIAGDQVEGRLVRFTLTASSSFRLYGCRVRYWRIGLYIDAGEKFITRELAA